MSRDIEGTGMGSPCGSHLAGELARREHRQLPPGPNGGGNRRGAGEPGGIVLGAMGSGAGGCEGAAGAVLGGSAGRAAASGGGKAFGAGGVGNGGGRNAPDTLGGLAGGVGSGAGADEKAFGELSVTGPVLATARPWSRSAKPRRSRMRSSDFLAYSVFG